MQPIRRHLLITACLFLLAGIAQAQRMPQDSWYFSHKWWRSGTGDGQFNKPSGVTVAPDSRVIVADTGNNRIQVFEADGTFVRKWGSTGTLDGQFNKPSGVTLASDRRVIVADTGNHRIQVFEADGTFVRKWGSYGTGDGQLSSPYGGSCRTPHGARLKPGTVRGSVSKNGGF